MPGVSVGRDQFIDLFDTLDLTQTYDLSQLCDHGGSVDRDHDVVLVGLDITDVVVYFRDVFTFTFLTFEDLIKVPDLPDGILFIDRCDTISPCDDKSFVIELWHSRLPFTDEVGEDDFTFEVKLGDLTQ